MKLTIFDNYHAGVSMMPEEEQDAFYGAVVRYAFGGPEPEFEGMAAAIWATIKPLVDKSLAGQENGAKGGNGRGNTKKVNPPAEDTGTKAENPTGKPTAKRVSENQKKRKEGNGKEKPEVFLSNSHADSVGSAAAGAAPPSSSVPICPTCSKPLRFSASAGRWRCTECGDVEPRFEAVVA